MQATAYSQEFSDHYALWELESHSPDWPAYRTAEAKRLVQERAVAMGGLPSISAFICSFNELRNTGILKPVRALKPAEPDTPEMTASDYYKLPVAVVQRKWKTDPDFRASVQHLIDTGRI